MSPTSVIVVLLLITTAPAIATDFQGAKDAVSLTSPDLVDQEQMAKFLRNLHQENIFEGVSEQSKSHLHQTLPELKSAASTLAKDEESSKRKYASLVAQLENLNSQLKALDANVHDAKVKVAAANKLREDSSAADAQIEHLKEMLKSEETRRMRLATTVSALQHSELLINGHIARALRSSQANIAGGTAEGSLVDEIARLVNEEAGFSSSEVAAKLEKLGAELDAQVAVLEAKKPQGRWRLADDSDFSG
jgi:predicted RNase H-like nuclease (RuvC/YqgF family)